MGINIELDLKPYCWKCGEELKTYPTNPEGDKKEGVWIDTCKCLMVAIDILDKISEIVESDSAGDIKEEFVKEAVVIWRKSDKTK